MVGANSKWREIADRLSERIRSGELKPGHRLESEQDLATLWGVSRPTAHRALSELKAAGLVVRQRRIGTVVADITRKSTHMIALVFDHVAKQFDFPQSELVKGIQRVLGKEFSIVWCDSLDDPAREANFLTRMALETDGIICFPIADPSNTPIMQKLHNLRVPLVLLDRIIPGFDGSVVVSNDRETIHQAIRMLVNKGHRRIGYFGFDKPNVSSLQTRYEAFTSTIEEAGIRDSARYCRQFIRNLEHEPELLRQAVLDAATALLNGPEPITAVFCAQDSFAAELLCYCDDHGILVPQDLEFVVVNEWPVHLLRHSERLHRIVRKKTEIGVCVAERLLALKSGEAIEHQILRIPAELYEGVLKEEIFTPGLVGARLTKEG